MNYLAHGYQLLDQPYMLAGAAIPDWLNVVNRRIRVRRRTAEPWLHSGDPVRRMLAAGVVRHHQDDDWFHRGRDFAELSLEFAVLLRDGLPADDGLRPSFLGHIMVELLLDNWLAEAQPGVLDEYYESLRRVDGRRVAEFVQAVTGKPPRKMAYFVRRFIEVRFLYDYADNAKLLYRLNQIMRRVGLALLPDTMLDLLPGMRQQVANRAVGLLAAPAKGNDDQPAHQVH